jgi:hypothetical protein
MPFHIFALKTRGDAASTGVRSVSIGRFSARRKASTEKAKYRVWNIIERRREQKTYGASCGSKTNARRAHELCRARNISFPPRSKNAILGTQRSAHMLESIACAQTSARCA